LDLRTAISYRLQGLLVGLRLARPRLTTDTDHLRLGSVRQPSQNVHHK
jgi:hypothetical protein